LRRDRAIAVTMLLQARRAHARAAWARFTAPRRVAREMAPCAPARPLSTPSIADGVTVVATPADAARVLDIMAKLPKSTLMAWDTEVVDLDLTTQSPVGNGRVICASVYAGPNVDWGGGPKLWIDNLDAAAGTLNAFAGCLRDECALKVWHNYSFDRAVLFNHGIDARGFAADTMHMARLWDTSRALTGGYGLEALSGELLARRKASMKDLFARPKLKKVPARGRGGGRGWWWGAAVTCGSSPTVRRGGGGGGGGANESWRPVALPPPRSALLWSAVAGPPSRPRVCVR
jgi:DNA polymerase I